MGEVPSRLEGLPQRRLGPRVGKHCATDQDLSALAAIRSTERGVMHVGLMRHSPRLAASHKPL